MPSKLIQLLIAWGGALLGSGLLVYAGSTRLQLPQNLLFIWALLLVLPIAMGLWIVARWQATSENL
jgi:hypothetical protein